MWRIARDSQALDLNSSYSYLLWCRDFAGTSLVARGVGKHAPRGTSAGGSRAAPASHHTEDRDTGERVTEGQDPASGARIGEPVGFVTGYLRPERPATLVIWQIAVDQAHRGRGLAAAMLDGLTGRLVGRGVREVETTITPDNAASIRLFTSFGERHGAAVRREVLFPGGLFPDGHESEVLYRIGPLPRTG